MGVFKVEIERHVSRVVELRQESIVYVDAPDKATAERAAYQLCSWNDIDEHCEEWKDDDGSRQASNDEVDRQPRVVRVGPAHSGIICTALAREILDLEDEGVEDGGEETD